MKTCIDHEKPDVYRESIAFCGWIGELLRQISPKAAAKDQLDRFLEIARGSALESAACLDVLAARKLVAGERILPAKERFVRIVNMLMGMLKRFSGRAEFLREDEGLYAIDQEHEHEHE